jgi:aspartyl-tRNA(Asn)/glutamyl-tRNA(Gln) amidotransferase subunit B
VKIETESGEEKEIRIERAHLEQDAGKSLHDQKPGASLIDLNRSGVALLEIVSFPDLRSAEECGLYMSKVRSILRAVGVCDGNMAEGSLRADVNLSLRRRGEEALGTRTEMKNLNSVKFIRQAVELESRRQLELLERGEEVLQETRLFDPVKGETRAMRSKEEAHDYRYFPCPDLLPVLVSEEEIEEERRLLPELPDERRARLMSEYGLGRYEAVVLSEESEFVNYFEEAVGEGGSGKLVANWMLSELFGLLNKRDIGIESSPIASKRLGLLVGLIGEGVISGKVGKQVFAKMLDEDTLPSAIVKREGWEVMSDVSVLEDIVEKLMSDHSDQVASYRGGKEKVLGWFVGQVMKETRGTASPEEVNRVLKEKLQG